MRFYHYILLSFGLFIAFIVVLVAKTYRVNNELVTEDYYKQELSYQNKIDKMGHLLPEFEPKWSQRNRELVVFFPEMGEIGTASGTIEFYRPSSASQDLKIPLAIGKTNRQVFPMELFSKGLYKARIEWTQGGIDYYNEQDIYLQ